MVRATRPHPQGNFIHGRSTPDFVRAAVADRTSGCSSASGSAARKIDRVSCTPVLEGDESRGFVHSIGTMIVCVCPMYDFTADEHLSWTINSYCQTAMTNIQSLRSTYQESMCLIRSLRIYHTLTSVQLNLDVH